MTFLITCPLKEKFNHHKINTQVFPEENRTGKPAPLHDQKRLYEKDGIGKNGKGKYPLCLSLCPKSRQQEGKRCREHKGVGTP